MTSFAYIPDDIPEGMIHVGWVCTGLTNDELDGCLMPLSRVDSGPDAEGEVHLFDANHHSSWAPVFAFRSDVES